MVEDNTKVAGVDVGKAWLDAAVAGLPDQSRVGNDEVGWARLVTWLMDQGVGLVGMEATGGYERGLSAALRDRPLAGTCFKHCRIVFTLLWLGGF
jgi:transposase